MMRALNLSAIVLAAVLVGDSVRAQEYLGDFVCGVCHQQKYDDYVLSGHPWKLN
jgi:hypothetical protein